MMTTHRALLRSPPPVVQFRDGVRRRGSIHGDSVSASGDRSSRPVYVRPAYLCAVWLGGAGGTAARYLLGSQVAGGSQLPLTTLMINVVGAFLLGMLLERLGRATGEPERRRLVRLLAGTGFLGGFTTYSALGH